jgi:hypothetical protein
MRRFPAAGPPLTTETPLPLDYVTRTLGAWPQVEAAVAQHLLPHLSGDTWRRRALEGLAHKAQVLAELRDRGQATLYRPQVLVEPAPAVRPPVPVGQAPFPGPPPFLRPPDPTRLPPWGPEAADPRTAAYLQAHDTDPDVVRHREIRAWLDTAQKRLDGAIRADDDELQEHLFQQEAELLTELTRLGPQVRQRARERLIEHYGTGGPKMVWHYGDPIQRFRPRERNAEVAADFLGSLMGAKRPPSVAIYFDKKADILYKPQLREIQITPRALPRTYAHEWGHRIEHTVKGVLEKVQEWSWRRFGDEAPVKLADLFPGYFRDNEYGRRDQLLALWPDDPKHAYYVSLEYPNGATEILSQGLEFLYTDPVHFARTDPDYFGLIMGILQGV